MVPDNRPNQPPAPRPAAKPVLHRKPTPPPPIVSYEDVVASCGHPEKFGLFEDRKDRFRRDRRKKVTDRPCRACREKRRLEEEEANRVKKVEKQQRVEETARVSQLQKKQQGGQNPGRLPDGAKFEVAYDATKEKWAGTLTIGDKVFSGTFGALFTLLSRLDRQYRESLPAAAPAPETPTTP